MAHVMKMALVDPRLLETLRTPIQPPIDTNLRDLYSEMTSILDKTGIDVSEKVRLYNQALLRYNDKAKMSATKPMPVVVVKEKETIGSRIKTRLLSRDRHNMAQPCMGVVIISIVSVIIVFLVILLTTSPQSSHRCPGGVVPWDARNYSNDTTILNVSEVMAALLLCEE